MDLKDVVKSPWTLAAVLLLGTNGGRKLIKTASKEVIRAGMVVSEKVKGVVAEVREEADDLVAEVQAERKTAGKPITTKTSS